MACACSLEKMRSRRRGSRNPLKNLHTPAAVNRSSSHSRVLLHLFGGLGQNSLVLPMPRAQFPLGQDSLDRDDLLSRIVFWSDLGITERLVKKTGMSTFGAG